MDNASPISDPAPAHRRSERQRIVAARRTTLLRCPIMEAANEGAPSFVIDPSVAKSVLAAHELHLVDVGSSSSSSSDGESSSENDDRASDGVVYANLKKPTKPTKLLRDALTNANGAVWARQRHCVSREMDMRRKSPQS